MALAVSLKVAEPLSAATTRYGSSSSYRTTNGGYYFYFDYLWPLVRQDVPDAPTIYPDVSLAMDFDTDHGYKKPPAWHVWHDDGDERGPGPAAYVVSGPGEQSLPWLPDDVELILRSKETGGRLLTVRATARD